MEAPRTARASIKKFTCCEVENHSSKTRMGASASSPVSVPLMRSRITEGARRSRAMLQCAPSKWIGVWEEIMATNLTQGPIIRGRRTRQRCASDMLNGLPEQGGRYAGTQGKETSSGPGG